MSESLRSEVLDLVVDIGKTRSKLLVLDADGRVVARSDHANAGAAAGGRALDTAGIETWLSGALCDLGPLRRRLARASFSAHGAAVASVAGDGLAWPVPDYEWEGFDERPPGWAAEVGAFDETQSPDLPRGLNLATQLDWLERHEPGLFARGQLMPYAQYWAWWFAGVAASEVSSLGCHTHLWNPATGDFSALARRRGWAQRFAALSRAWEVLGPLRPALSRRLGLPPGVQVHVGAHDSNACLARYLRSHPRLTLVTTGTWVVVMAPGAPDRRLRAEHDQVSNVSVRHERVPTGRFMGGREVQHLCAGADPALASLADLDALLARGVMALPAFEDQGGPFRGRSGHVVDSHGLLALAALAPSQRATLAALYAAQVTACIVESLGGVGPVVVEGPFAANPVYTGVLASLLPMPVMESTDELEGTARGAWMLAHWTEPRSTGPRMRLARPAGAAALHELHQRWCRRLPAAAAVA